MENIFIRKNKYNVNKYLEKNINSNIYIKKLYKIPFPIFLI